MLYNEHLLDETESNIRFVLPGQVMLGEAKLSVTSLDPAKTNLMLEEVEFNKCFIIAKTYLRFQTTSDTAAYSFLVCKCLFNHSKPRGQPQNYSGLIFQTTGCKSWFFVAM